MKNKIQNINLNKFSNVETCKKLLNNYIKQGKSQYFQQAECYFYLKEYKKAKDLFLECLKSNNHKYELYYYLPQLTLDIPYEVLQYAFLNYYEMFDKETNEAIANTLFVEAIKSWDIETAKKVMKKSKINLTKEQYYLLMKQYNIQDDALLRKGAYNELGSKDGLFLYLVFLFNNADSKSDMIKLISKFEDLKLDFKEANDYKILLQIKLEKFDEITVEDLENIENHLHDFDKTLLKKLMVNLYENKNLEDNILPIIKKYKDIDLMQGELLEGFYYLEKSLKGNQDKGVYLICKNQKYMSKNEREYFLDKAIKNKNYYFVKTFLEPSIINGEEEHFDLFIDTLKKLNYSEEEIAKVYFNKKKKNLKDLYIIGEYYKSNNDYAKALDFLNQVQQISKKNNSDLYLELSNKLIKEIRQIINTNNSKITIKANIIDSINEIIKKIDDKLIGALSVTLPLTSIVKIVQSFKDDYLFDFSCLSEYLLKSSNNLAKEMFYNNFIKYVASNKLSDQLIIIKTEMTNVINLFDFLEINKSLAAKFVKDEYQINDFSNLTLQIKNSYLKLLSNLSNKSSKAVMTFANEEAIINDSIFFLNTLIALN